MRYAISPVRLRAALLHRKTSIKCLSKEKKQMLSRTCIAGVSIIAVLLLLSSVSIASVPEWMMRSGTIGNALQQPDGTHVYLDAVIVDKIKAEQENPYLTIHECFNRSDRIIVVTPSAPELRADRRR
jgi:hypothetical protein